VTLWKKIKRYLHRGLRSAMRTQAVSSQMQLGLYLCMLAIHKFNKFSTNGMHGANSSCGMQAGREFSVILTHHAPNHRTVPPAHSSTCPQSPPYQSSYISGATARSFSASSSPFGNGPTTSQSQEVSTSPSWRVSDGTALVAMASWVGCVVRCISDERGFRLDASPVVWVFDWLYVIADGGLRRDVSGVGWVVN